MTVFRHSSKEEPHAPSLSSGAAAGESIQRRQKSLVDVACSQQAAKQQLAVARAAIARSRALLAQGASRGGAADQPRLTDAPSQVSCPPLSQRKAAAVEPGDLGTEIAAAILRLVPDLIDEHGLIFEIADPEPVLRGVASAYAAIAYALPGGRNEAWALLGLLALELAGGDQKLATS